MFRSNTDHPGRARIVSRTAMNAFIVLAIFIVLVIPVDIRWISPSEFLYLPLEIILAGILLLLPGRIGLALRIIIALLLAIGSICKMADMAALQIFSRPFNPLLDAHLLGDGLHLLQGSLGKIASIAIATILLAVTGSIFVASYFAIGRVQALLLASHKPSMMLLSLGLLCWIGIWLAQSQRASAAFYQLLAEHTVDTYNSFVDLKAFRKIVNIDSYTNTPGDSLLGALQGKDVLVIFIESYGRTVLDKPEFAAHIRPLLEKGSADLASAGFSARSAYLTSPTAGGISWLAHSTFMSGLWIDSQVRYDSLTASERPTLNRLFKRAGWRTLAVQPAHTMDWPAGAYFGYDKIYSAADLGYQGKPFNWVTMPDQYTLSAVQKYERQTIARTPIMAEIALISSHAPWTPIPHLIDWQQVGDGRIFNAQASSGDSPEVVWQDTARIQEQYRKAIEYSLETIISYALNYGDHNLVLLVLGDHQPAPLVTGESSNRDVLVHLISRDPKVMAAVQDWQWTEGMLPAGQAPVWPMDTMRNRLLETFSAQSAKAVSE